MEDLKKGLKKEEDKLVALKEKRKNLDKQIKESQNKIDQCNFKINQKKFSEMSKILDSKGISVDEFMEAVKKGDVLELQEKIEQKGDD